MPDNLLINNSYEMKKYFVLSFLIILLVCINTYSQPPVYGWMFDWQTRYTPTGEAISAGVLYPDYELTDKQKEDSKDYWLGYYNWRIQFKGEATRTYNCHGYAWHVSEGGDNVWISTPNDDKYWTEGTYDASYKEISSQTDAKVAFAETADHSAIKTSSANMFISKWGQAPKFEHDINDCPYEPKTNLKYYTLDPKMTGSTSNLCYNVTRDFNTNITNMPDGTLTWTKGNNLSIIGEDDEPEFTVKGGSSFGWSYVKLQINTPSGFTWESTKSFWTGLFNQTWVSGWPSVCPNITYTYTALVPGGHDPSYSYSWTYPYGWIYISQDENEIDLRTTSTPIGGTVRVSITNECGSSNYSGITVYPGSCYYYYMMYPNPASEEVTISIVKPETIIFEDIEISDVEVTKDISTDQDTYTIRIFNNMGILELSATRSGTSFNIPLPNLRDGTYVVEVSDGKNSYREQLIIKHE